MNIAISGVLRIPFKEKISSSELCEKIKSHPRSIKIKLSKTSERLSYLHNGTDAGKIFVRNSPLGMTCSYPSIAQTHKYLDSKVHGANMGPIWGRKDPDGPHVGPINFVIWDYNKFAVHTMINAIHHCGLAKLYCNTDFSRYWLRQWLIA